MWTQHSELAFIAGMGKHRNSPASFYGSAIGQRARLLEGYIKSLTHRTRWFSEADADELRISARSELARAIGDDNVRRARDRRSKEAPGAPGGTGGGRADSESRFGAITGGE